MSTKRTHPGELGKDARVLAWATRDLLAGEEMFADYGVGLPLRTACVCATSVVAGDGTSLNSGPGYESECCQ